MNTKCDVLIDIFDQLVDWIKDNGCRVFVHKARHIIGGCNGYYESTPYHHIRVAMKNRPMDEAIGLLLHEFCHYIQHKENFYTKEIDEANELYELILNGHKLHPDDVEFTRKFVALGEYDCDMRAIDLAKELGLDHIVKPDKVIKSANSYNRHVAWSVGSMNKSGSAIFMANHKEMGEVLWKGKKVKRMTEKQIFEPISAEHKRAFDKAAKVFKKNKGQRKRHSASCYYC